MDADTPRSLPAEIVARPDLTEAYQGTDRLGRQVPHRLSQLGILGAIAPRMWSAIPGEFWGMDLNADGYSEAAVSCPCGHVAHVEVLTAVACECERIYAFAGESVLVAYATPDGEPPAGVQPSA